MTREQLKNTTDWLAQEENRDALMLLLRQIKYLLTHFRFRKLRGQLTFGFEDPYTVGKLLSLLSIFYPVYGEQFSITPVFDRSVFSGDFALKGHIRLIHVLVAAVKILRNKALRTQLIKLLNE